MTNHLHMLPIYYINLNRCETRNKHMLNLFKSNKIDNFTRIDAYDGEIINNYTDITVLEDDNVRKISTFQQCCIFSHLKTIKTAYDNNDNMAIIVEDDLSMDYRNKWNHLFDINNSQNIIKNAPDDWEILKLHCCYPKYVNILIKRDRKNLCKYQKWDERSFSALFYIINRTGMKKILDKYLINDKFTIYNNHENVSDILIFRYLNTYDYTQPIFNVAINQKSNIGTPLSLFEESNELIKKYYK